MLMTLTFALLSPLVAAETGDQLAERVKAVAERTEAPVMLVVTERGIEDDLRRWLGQHTDLNASVTHVAPAYLGEIDRLIEGAGARCGLLVEGRRDAWETSEQGDCAETSEPVVAEAAPTDDCFPPCSPGYLCHEQLCIQACNPPCGTDDRCTEDRTCVPKSAPLAVVDADGEGTICVFRLHKLLGSQASWDVAIDEVPAGSVSRWHYLCVRVPPGEHMVRLTATVARGAGFVNAGTGGFGTVSVAVHAPPTQARRATVADGETVNIMGEEMTGPGNDSIQLREITSGEADWLRRKHEPMPAQ
jgi:hypothetical protein